MSIHLKILFLKIDFFRERGKEGKKERNIDLSFHVFMHSLVDSCLCPDGDRTRNLGTWQWCPNRPSSPVRHLETLFLRWPQQNLNPRRCGLQQLGSWLCSCVTFTVTDTWLLFCSVSTEALAGVHQPLRRERPRQADLREEGGAPVRAGRHQHRGHR